MNIEIKEHWYACYTGQHIDLFKNDCKSLDPQGKIYIVPLDQKSSFIMTRNFDTHRFVVYVDHHNIIQEIRCG